MHRYVIGYTTYYEVDAENIQQAISRVKQKQLDDAKVMYGWKTEINFQCKQQKETSYELEDIIT